MTSFIDALQAYNEKLKALPVQKQVETEMKEAMRLGNKEKRDLLRVVMGEFSREGKELSDEQALKVIKKMHSNAVNLGNEWEKMVLEFWVPKVLTEDATKRLIERVIYNGGFSGMQDIGKIMGVLKTQEGVDMKLASKLVKEML